MCFEVFIYVSDVRVYVCVRVCACVCVRDGPVELSRLLGACVSAVT